MDKPVFDYSDNNLATEINHPRIHISAEKKAAREELAVAMRNSSAKITVCKPKNAPVEREWKPTWKPTRKPANDNRELISWPLLDKLKRDGMHEHAETVEHYCGLVALMEANPLQGQNPVRSDGFVYEERSTINDDDIDDAAAAKWPSDQVNGGDLERKGIRERDKAPGTASRARQTDEKTVVVMRDMAVKFDERVLIAQIDNRNTLPRLRAALGPLVSPFEDAVLGGSTFGAIGEARHYKGKQAEAAGKVLVMTALDALIAEWSRIREEQQRAEDLADANVERRRAVLNERQVAFLRRVA
ncbi:conserved hypothetical protein [Agrobacterium fabacearum S56]|uniref:hypothetical protein n=1 Tax=Agrobacterium tumefaciens TaxID=358 RepID=UPI0009B93ABC|nr:hypothetical protein [Agrobacterium tumefaciens]CUW87451.1 conserved hypothetical protein [Agrobacterium fabacearum S56]